MMPPSYNSKFATIKILTFLGRKRVVTTLVFHQRLLHKMIKDIVSTFTLPSDEEVSDQTLIQFAFVPFVSNTCPLNLYLVIKTCLELFQACSRMMTIYSYFDHQTWKKLKILFRPYILSKLQDLMDTHLHFLCTIGALFIWMFKLYEISLIFDFFRGSTLTDYYKHFIITIIPKVATPWAFADFHPISLC